MIKFTKGGLFERLLTVYGMQKDLGNLCNIIKAGLLSIITIAVIIPIASATVVIDTQLIYHLLTGESLLRMEVIESTYGTAVAAGLLAFCFISASIQVLVVFVLCTILIQEWLEENPDKPVVTNIKEMYRSIKDKYCPTIEWIKKGDK